MDAHLRSESMLASPSPLPLPSHLQFAGELPSVLPSGSTHCPLILLGSHQPLLLTQLLLAPYRL